MPTERQRLQALVRCGLLPETAQRIIDDGAGLVGLEEREAARITSEDRTRARVFVLYASLIPDWMRLLWNAPEAAAALAEANG